MHWSDAYVGREYIEGSQDCAWLVEDVNREVFGREVPVPSVRETNIFKQTVQINEQLETFTEIALEDATDGDVVLMVCRGRLSHTGVYTCIHGASYVLHNVKGFGVLLQRLEDLRRVGLKYQGVYRFHQCSEAT